MTSQLLERSFAKMGARVKFGELVPERRLAPRDLVLDVRSDQRGEYFLIRRLDPSRMS